MRQLFLILWILHLEMGMSSESQKSFCKVRAKHYLAHNITGACSLKYRQTTGNLSHCSLLRMGRQFQPKVLNVHCQLPPLRPCHDSCEQMRLSEIRYIP